MSYIYCFTQAIFTIKLVYRNAVEFLHKAIVLFYSSPTNFQLGFVS